MGMDLFKKLHVFPSDIIPTDLTAETTSGVSTLVKPDISCFHESAVALGGGNGDGQPIVSDYDQGFKQGQEQSNAAFQDTIKIMQTALDELQADFASITREIEAGYLSVIADCLRAIFPVLMRGGTDLELQSVLKHACNSALKGQIQLFVHPDDQSHCEALCREKDILVTVDDALKPLQMRLKWAGGGADIDCLSVASLCLERLNAAQLANSQNLLEGRSHA